MTLPCGQETILAVRLLGMCAVSVCGAEARTSLRADGDVADEDVPEVKVEVDADATPAVDS